MLSILTRGVLFIVILSTIGLLIPDNITANIDNAITYLVSQQYNLNYLFNAQTLIDAESVFIGFAIVVATFVLLRAFMKVTGGTQ